MGETRFERLRRVYERAESLSPEERPAFLDEACAGDEALRGELERMLEGSAAESFLAPPFELEPAPPAALAGGGRRVGPYRILRVVGVGGMGVVYEAEQEAPRRRVALKTLRADAVSPTTARRLAYEAELLARLEHPSIARVYEAGVHFDATEGRDVPFFAMEYVEGATDVLTYARREELDTPALLALFLAVCDAVAHGHRHGVIHRDLKPGNVLVGVDGSPKVIDFGVARSTDAEGAAHTRLTRAGDVVGTLFWMAPEQLGGDPAAVDTRTDVYALGLLLYELLFRRGPYELAGRSLTEVARIVRDEQPVPPRTLRADVPDDLGWIALRALEKEPRRRYPSVDELAVDVRRYLAHRPVEAGPPSTVYRLRKLVRRHRITVAAAALALVALGAGGGVGLAGLLRARTEADKFRGINEVLTQMFEGVRAERVGRDVLAVDLLDGAAARLERDFDGRPEVEAPLRCTLARSYGSLGEPAKAERHARVALALFDELEEPASDARLSAAYELGAALHELGRHDEARALAERHLDAARRARLDADHRGGLAVRLLHARVLTSEGRARESLASLEPLARESRDALGARHEDTLSVELALVRALLGAGELERAERLAREVVARCEAGSTSSAHSYRGRLALAEALVRGERWEEARELLEGLVPSYAAVRGETHPLTLTAKRELARVYLALGRAGDARRLLGEAIAGHEALAGTAHPSTVRARGDLEARSAGLVEATRLLEDAVRAEEASAGADDTDPGDAREIARAALGPVREAQRLRERVDALSADHGPDDARVLSALHELGAHLRKQGDVRAAEPILRDVIDGRRRVLGDPHREVCESVEELGVLLYQKGDVRAALEVLTENWRTLEELVGPGDRATIRAAVHRASILGILRRHEEALPLLAEAYDALAALDPDDPELLTVALNLFELYRVRGAADEALAIAHEAVERARRHPSPEHPLRAQAFFSLADLLRLQGSADEALPLFEEALAAAEESPAVSAELRARVHFAHGLCLRAAALPEAALAELLVAYELDRERLDDGHRGLEARVREVARILDELGRPVEAAEWRARAGSSD